MSGRFRTSPRPHGRSVAILAALRRDTLAHPGERVADRVGLVEEFESSADDVAAMAMHRGDQRAGEAIGAAADALGAQGFEKRFIPDSDDIIAASDLLSHGEFEVLTFTAPTEPADYEVLCTFPGHRGTMHGIMTVEH